MITTRLGNEQLFHPIKIGYSINFIFSLLVFFLVGDEVVSSVTFFLVSSFINLSQTSQSFIIGSIVDNPMNNRYWVVNIEQVFILETYSDYGYFFLKLLINFLIPKYSNHPVILSILNYLLLLRLNHQSDWDWLSQHFHFLMAFLLVSHMLHPPPLSSWERRKGD